MKHAEVLARLKAWADLHAKLSAPLDAFTALTDGATDSPLLNPVYALWDAYTKEISSVVGDTAEWLDWYEFQCEMGKKPMSVEFYALGEDGQKSDQKTTVVVDGLDRLAEVICAVSS